MIVNIATSLEIALLAEKLEIHLHGSKDLNIPCGISIPPNSSKLFVNLKSKQNQLSANGSYKKVRLALELPIDTAKNAEFVAHKVFLKTDASDVELKHQSMLDEKPGLIHVTLDHKCKKTDLLKTSVYETLLELDLAKLQSVKLMNERKVQIVLGIVTHLFNIHLSGHLHGDLKPENMIIDSMYNARCIDYGFTFDPKKDKPTGCLSNGFYGSILNTPPELFGLLWKDQLSSVDFFLAETFSLSVALWKWLKEWPAWTQEPYSLFKQKLRPDKKSRDDYYDHILKYVDEQMKECQNSLKLIVLKMMHPDPKQRMTLSDAKTALEKLKKS